MEPYEIANNIELEVVALEVIDTTLRFMLDEDVSYRGIMPTEIINSLSQSIGKLNNYLGELYMLCNLRFPKEEKPKRCKEFSVKDQEWNTGRVPRHLSLRNSRDCCRLRHISEHLHAVRIQ